MTIKQAIEMLSEMNPNNDAKVIASDGEVMVLEIERQESD